METLPVEILHRIFDGLDAETILLSLRPVCRLFRAIVTTYDRYILDMQLISKSNFYLLCRLIKPQNVIALTISNDEQISDQTDLFLSIVHLRQFTRLHSLTLRDIDEFQLNFILKRVNLSLLTSFSFTIRKYDDRCIKTTNSLFTPIIAQSNLRKLEFDIKTTRLSQISWPITCTIQYLTINNYITINDLLTILQGFPYMHTIILRSSFIDFDNYLIPKVSTVTSFPQLVSLTIEKLTVSINQLELFLSMTPSLVYLKLIGGTKMLDGQRWEQFIQINLPLLAKFEFLFTESGFFQKMISEMKLIIASFQTSFWIEHKKWYVTCDNDTDSSSNIRLYTIPICESSLKYESASKKVSLSNYTMMIEDNPNNNVKSIAVILNKATTDDILQKKAISTNLMFPKVTEIEIDFYTGWLSFSLSSLSAIIDITQIVRMKLKSSYFDENRKNTLMNIEIFLEQAHNLSSLIIQCSLTKHKLPKTIKNLCSIIPRRLKHLQIPINNLDQIKMILERCENLLTIKFEIKSTFSKEVIQWFIDNTVNSTSWKGTGTVTVWLGKKTIQSNDVQTTTKRIKLMDEQSEFETI